MFCSRTKRKCTSADKDIVTKVTLSLLLVAFIIIKILNLAPISWLWVFSPLWIPCAIIVSIFFIGCLILGASRLISQFKKYSSEHKNENSN